MYMYYYYVNFCTIHYIYIINIILASAAFDEI